MKRTWLRSPSVTLLLTSAAALIASLGLSACNHLAQARTPSVEEILSAHEDNRGEAPAPHVARDMRIPVEMNALVQKWIAYFTERDRERFQRFLNRGQQYRDIVESVLEENDLPAELYYLAMIESGFRTDAHSHAKAVGVWQFIPGTGTRYGLQIGSQVDERRDPIRATEAAAKYLRDLYNVFGSWHLAMAAYNAGEIRVLRAVFKGRSRNFWDLARAKVLPSETINYVPKFLAVVLIGQDPEKYGFRVDENVENYPRLDSVSVPGGVSLADVSKYSGLSLAVLNKVNPHLLRRRVPSDHKEYEIWIPSGEVSAVKRAHPRLLSIAKHVQKSNRRSVASRGSEIHVVRRGETLSSIAQRYKVSVGHLMRMNHLKSSRILAGKRLRTKARSYEPLKYVRYKVRRGDNLILLAQKFNTSVGRIRSLNRIKRNRILIGQTLKIESHN